MKKLLCLCLLSISLVGCSVGPNVRVLSDNPPWCKDYIVRDPETGEKYFRYNSPQGNLVQPLGKGE